MTEEELATAEQMDEEGLSDEEQEMAKLKEAIQVQVDDIGTLRKKLTITVPAATISERRSEQFSEIKRDSVVPGFRKGHAPMRLIEKRFGGDVTDQLSSQLFSSSYLAAVEKEDLKTIGDPLVWAKDPKAGDQATDRLVPVDEAFDMIKLPDTGDFTYACEVEVRPEFELPKLEGLKITQPAVAIGKEQIAEQIDRLRAMRGQYQPLADGTVQADDLVVCKMKATVGDTVLLEEDNCQLAARPQRYAGILMETLGKDLAGAKVGDSRKVKGQIPDDYQDESVRGQTADVDLEILDIKRLVLPELDDAFLASLGCENKNELEEWIKNNLEAQKSDELRRSMRQQVCDHLLKETTLELPQGLSQRQADRVAARKILDMSRMGIPEAEIMKRADEIKTGARDEAINDLKLNFIFEKIAEEWEVEITEDQINGQIAAIAQRQNRRFDRVRDDLIRNKSMPMLYVQVRDEAIIDRILASAELAADEPEKPAASKPKKKVAKKPTKSASKKTTKKTAKKTKKARKKT